jgi:hypothetical protein
VKQALIKKERVETNGLYIRKNNTDLLSAKCNVNINIMPLITSFYIVNSDNAIGVSNFNFKRILDITQ